MGKNNLYLDITPAKRSMKNQVIYTAVKKDISRVLLVSALRLKPHFLSKITMVGLGFLAYKMRIAPTQLFSQVYPKDPQKHNGWERGAEYETPYIINRLTFNNVW